MKDSYGKIILAQQRQRTQRLNTEVNSKIGLELKQTRQRGCDKIVSLLGGRIGRLPPKDFYASQTLMLVRCERSDGKERRDEHYSEFSAWEMVDKDAIKIYVRELKEENKI